MQTAVPFIPKGAEDPGMLREVPWEQAVRKLVVTIRICNMLRCRAKISRERN